MTDVRMSRATTRVAALLPADVRVGESEQSGVCLDLSAGGLGIRVEPPPQEGQSVSVRVHMPGGQIILAHAEVMHSGQADQQRCGLRFLDLSQGALTAIHSFVAWKNREVLPLPLNN